MALLAARNLLEIEGERLALHQTLADVARAATSPEAVAHHRAHYLALAGADRNDWRRIEAAYVQVKWAWRNTPDQDEGLFEFVGALWTYQSRQGLWGDYLSWAQRGLALAEVEGRKKQVGNLLVHIGFIYNALGQRQEALSYYQRALPIREEVGDRAGLAVTLNNIGGVYDNLGQRQEALNYYQRALPIREEVGDRAGLAVTLNNIGGVYNALGQRQEALNYFQRALPIQEEVGDRAGESVTRWWLGLLMQAEGNLAEAVTQLRRAVELAAQVQSPYLEQIKAALAQAEAELASQTSHPE